MAYDPDCCIERSRRRCCCRRRPGRPGGTQPFPGHLSLVECRNGVKSILPPSAKRFSGDSSPILRAESRRDSTIQATSSIVGKCCAIVTALRRRGSGRDWSCVTSIRRPLAHSKALVLSSGMVMAGPRSRSSQRPSPTLVAPAAIAWNLWDRRSGPAIRSPQRWTEYAFSRRTIYPFTHTCALAHKLAMTRTPCIWDQLLSRPTNRAAGRTSVPTTASEAK